MRAWKSPTDPSFRSCSVEGCDRRAVARGWCDKHYQRWRHTGDPTATPRLDPDRIRADRDAYFWANVAGGSERGFDECWPWLRKPTSNGYGQLRGYDGQRHAHVFAFELANGPVPIGPDGLPLTVDHTCHQADLDCPGGPACAHRLCCNPAHLRAITHAENVAQGIERRRARSKRKPRPHLSGRLCAVDGCGLPHSARGYCVMHYRRFTRHGDPLVHKR